MNVYGGTREADRQTWATPDDVFAEINALYGPFDLDAAASAHNAKCPTFFSLGRLDALRNDWTGRGGQPTLAWCNPPYRDAEPWVRQAELQLLEGNCKRVVMLLPNATDTKWFGHVVENARGIRFGLGPLGGPEFERSDADMGGKTWWVHFWPRRIQFVPPPGVRRSSNPKGSVVLVGDAVGTGGGEGWPPPERKVGR